MNVRYAIATFCGLAIVVAAVALLSAGGSPSLGASAVARAAETTSQSGGAQVQINATITAPGATITMAGAGHMSFKAGEGELTIKLGGLPAAAESVLHGSSLEMTELIKAGTLYMDSPLFAGKLPGGARWIKLDLASTAAAMGINPSSMTSFGANPGQYLAYLKAAGASVTAVGHGRVRGVPATRYAGQINLLQAMEKAAGSNVTKVREAFSKTGSELGSTTMPVEVWIDSSGRVRKETMTISSAGAGTKMDVEYFDFGSTPSITAPSGSEVYDLTSRTLQGLGAAL